MQKIKSLAVFNALSFIVHLLTNFIVQAKTINSKNGGEISAQYETIFTPAGMTFVVWGFIYSSLGILCLYQLIISSLLLLSLK